MRPCARVLLPRPPRPRCEAILELALQPFGRYVESRRGVELGLVLRFQAGDLEADHLDVIG